MFAKNALASLTFLAALTACGSQHSSNHRTTPPVAEVENPQTDEALPLEPEAPAFDASDSSSAEGASTEQPQSEPSCAAESNKSKSSRKAFDKAAMLRLANKC